MAEDGAGEEGAESTLNTENTIRTRYLRDKLKETYYANRHAGQAAAPGGPAREDIARASPELTLKIMMYAKYLFLEIWQSRFLDTPIEEIVEEMEIEGYPGLGDILWQDAETKGLVETMRHQFSAHQYFPLDEAVRTIEDVGFDRFWRAAQRVLLFKDAVTIVRHEPGSIDRLAGKGSEISVVDSKSRSGEEAAEMKRRYSGAMYNVTWDADNPKEVMQECLACIRMLRKEQEISTVLHHCYNTRSSLVRFVNASYNMKYAILEMWDFIRRYEKLKLELPDKPDFLRRKNKYKKYRNRYAAHNDEEGRVTGIMELLESEREFISMLPMDMEEAILVSGRLFPAYVPRAQIELPTRDRIAEMEGEIGGVKEKFRGQIGEEQIKAYEADCERHRGRVDRALGLAG